LTYEEIKEYIVPKLILLAILSSPGWISYSVYTVLAVGENTQNLAAHITAANTAEETRVEERAQLAEALKGVIDSQQRAEKRDLTMRGQGRAGSFGGDDAYLRINTESQAILYQSGDKVKVTNLTADGHPTEVMEIRGEWSNNNSDILASFSSKACDVLEIEGTVKILLEPVLEK
jgi:hypothetical protein